ncbi:hypothetical protein BZA77DRAFT_105309 [Pyronema omphalodes]|nr:hypothetical protein BZA77DRAFT_105309 [Pyronema omphalodes]
MSNAMKKLKLLQHHISAASVGANNISAGFPTPPASPVFNAGGGVGTYPNNSYDHYQPSHYYQPPPPPPPHHQHHHTPYYQRPDSRQQHQHQQHYYPPAQSTMPGIPGQCLLPGGFMVLTPSSSHDHLPTAPTRRPPRLTKEAVSAIGKDSRLARWERVLNYVREQRTTTIGGPVPTSPKSCPSIISGGGRGMDSIPPPPSPAFRQDRKRRAEEMALIDLRCKELERIDRVEQDTRSLWSGGSGGTNGVDEFVWSEDEDDDVLPMPKGPEPVKILPGERGMERIREEGVEEGVFAMDESRTGRWSGMNGMQQICREGELEGGLGRLVGRRMSAAY